ncbi:hypothetical protein L6452_14098 [Arctium lappa]|uniref:Uncharacterized protein n=1 Tax=Arctium lappa TaxID=4217 RepID=A0ACB9CK45_ARCLA|nr:hypothetical protein L6452_14098 [Arctium lappa]
MAADLIVAVAVKIGEFVFEPFGKSFSYLYHYSKNITSFQSRVPVLENSRIEIQDLVEEAKRNGEHVLPQVAEWLTAADGFVDESRKFLEDHQGSPSCTNLVSRYRVSKIAKKRVLAVNKLLQDGKFDRVSRQVPPPLWSASTGNLETFESRNLTFKAIMEALKDDNISVIGVYGMGGVGKTTLVKEVAKQASEDKLFDEMVISVISQTMNVRNIQGEIADKLGLKLEQESESGRATRLCERLKQSTRVLLILDDVWRLLDLEAIGIPHNDVHKGCKLLLTSRSKDVCNEINAQVCVPVNVLSKVDAWNLFSKMANITHDSSDIHLLATKVAERCAGLPIAIVTVARALRGKSKHAWSDALCQLQNPPPKNIKGMQKYVYSSLELSYNFLETDEIKSCFLLCSLFKEDVEIPVEILVRYGMGLRLFQNVYKLEAARDRTYALVEGLKACCLLLDGKGEEYVRMHDVIRDFAILIASSGENMSLVRHDAQSFGSPEGEPLNSFAAISLASTSITELPSGLDCPKLEILLLQFHSDSIQVPVNFFEGMKELKVLTMSDMPILSLPSSIRSLWKMRTLCLEHCKLRDISSIGDLTSLQILSFLGSNVKRLPEEIGQLTQLRLLDLTDCEELTTIPPKVLSRLSSLESLNMMNSFVNWSGEDKDMRGNNPSLSELKMLPCLRSLEVNILNVNLIPKDLLLENLIKFKIYVGSYWLVSLTHQYTRSLKLRVDEGISLPDGLRMLLKQAQYLILEYCPHVLKNILYDLRREGFRNLRGLELYGNCDIEYLVDTIGCKPGDVFPTLEKLEVVSLENLKEICHGHLPVRSFSTLQELDLKYLPEFICLWKEKDTQEHTCLVNLRNVSVHTCHKLEILFPLHTATDTGLLHDLCIFNCGILRGVFSSDTTVAGDRRGEIVLPVLNALELSLLPQLRSFYPKMNEISTSDDNLEIPLFGANVIFPKLQVLRLRELPRVKALWHLQMPEESFGRLKVLRITRCNAISKLIPFYMVQRLKNFESLSIINCDMIEEIFELEDLVNVEETTAKLVDLPPLKELVLCGLSELKHLWWNKSSCGYVSLQFLRLLTITRCDSLTSIFSLSAFKGLVQLQCLEIEWCALVKEIVSFERGESSNMVVFPHLHTLRLNHLPDLTSFCEDYKTLDWPSLKILNIANCPNMKTFPASEFEQIVDHAGNLCATVQPLFNEKVEFPNTEELHIQYMDNLVEVWDHQLPDQTFSSLQVLNVRGCEKLIHIGSTHMLARLQMLSKLYIEDCGSVEEIFVTEHTVNQDDTVVSLFSLTELRLKCLSKLTHIWWNMDSQRGALHFQNLSSLEVSGCDHLKYILSTSITKGLVQLQELKINSCELVEEVVLNDLSVEDQVEVVDLPRLRTLELKNLPNLKSFCSINGMFQLPSLRVLKVMDCPKTKTFASNLTRSNLILENVSDELLENHFPIITEPFFNGEMLLRMLEKLSIEGLSSSRGLWHDQLPYDSFHRLKNLKVKRCKKLLRLVPELKNLEKLYVEECDSLEEILGIEQSIWGGDESHLICKLRTLRLQNLPKLVAIWWNNHLNGVLKYPKFSSIKIIKCDGLMKVFSVLVVKHFIHLEELHLANCLMMKEVVAEDEHKGNAGEKVVFPQLHSLGLLNLPNLTSFCSGGCMLEFPSLENLNLEACPNMSTFSLGWPVTPKLNAIAVENGEQLWKSNLNSTIKHLFSAKDAKR